MTTIAIVALLAATLIHSAHSQCLWHEDRSQGVHCAWPAIDPATAAVELVETAPGTTHLSIECDPTALYESHLPSTGLFENLATIEVLRIDTCKLLQLAAGSLGGLGAQLHTLHVNTHNAVWGQANRLQLAAQLFANLTELQHLNLAANNLRALPSGLLCPLRGLQHLNVSHNRLRSGADLGLSACDEDSFAQLRTIDVSYNELITIDAASWARSDLRAVQIVRLQANNLTRLERGLFDGMPALRVLNISDNQLETMPSGLFARNTQLQELHLQGNKLYQLPVDVFANLGELLVLDLSGNQLSSHYVDAAIFAHLQRLVVLNLSNNALTRIDVATFAQLSFLQILDLKNNSIGYIDDQTFAPLVNLHTLNLAGNRLHIVNNDLFDGLFILSRLVLSNNLITVVESAAFRNTSSLKELDLSSNQLSDVPVAVAALHMLRSLDLGENRITTLRNDSFRNLQQLTGLRLMDNLIANVTVGCLFDMPKLNVLNLARNKIQTIELGAFERNTEIEAIRLDRNLLADVNGIFAALNSLQWLNLSENQLVWFDYAFIPKDLKWLDIHGNYIEALGNYYQLRDQISVTTLDASHNRITELSPDAVPNSIELFFVNNNQIRNVYPNTFAEKINLTRVDLYANALAKLSLHAVRIAAMRQHRALPDFYLAGNPLECDCTMGWLRHRAGDPGSAAAHHSAQHQQPRIADYELVECLVAHKRTDPVRLLASLQHSDFLCRFETQCPASCHCCEFKTCHCQVKCPDQCSCFADQATGMMQVNCGKQNAVALPERIPMDATQLYVDGNNYLELKSYAFASLKRVKALYLNGSNVIHVQSHALTGLSGLQRLHLNDNKLTVLDGHEFQPLYALRELYLQDNMLTFVDNATFAGLRHLQVLRLDGNRLATLTTWQMQSTVLRGLRQLTLGDNMWSCGCDFLQQFIPFVYDNDVDVLDAAALQCGDGSADRQVAIRANMTIESCGGLLAISTNSVLAASALPEGIPHGYVPLAGFALTIVLVLVVLVAVFTVKERLCCAYRGNLANDAEKATVRPLYDALVLTAVEDSDYVAGNIVAAMRQQKPAFTFGMQHRNVSAGQIVQAANRSRKIVIYLSNAFLQTEWRRPEVRSAISNSWIPGKIVLVQTPHVQFHSNTDRELINNIGRGIVLLRTWEMDFIARLSGALDVQQPGHYMEIGGNDGTMMPMPSAAGDPSEKIWKSTNSRLVHPYTYVVDYVDGDQRNDSYYSSATAESTVDSPHMLAKKAAGGSTTTMATHVYAGIDSDYGSVTNEDSMVSVHKPLVAAAVARIPPQSPVTSTTSAANTDTEATSMMSADADCEDARNGFFV